MSGFAKIWTGIFNDEWFMGLSATGRGIFIQLIVYAKLMGDTGGFFIKSVTLLAQMCGADRATTSKFLHSCHDLGKIVLEKRGKTLSITITNYQYWQGLKRWTDHLDRDQLGEKSTNPTRRSKQSRAEQSKLDAGSGHPWKPGEIVE